MKTKRIMSALMALLLMATLPVSAFAAEWYLEDGNITITATETTTGEGDTAVTTQTQKVAQGEKTYTDAAPVITQRDSTKGTNSTITVTTTGDAVAEFAIQNINVREIYETNIIDIGDSSAVIHVDGDNTIYVSHYWDYKQERGEMAMIHVSSGNLTLTSATGGKLVAYNYDSHGADIGSDPEEDFSGTIHITGDINLQAGGTDGGTGAAAIGSGNSGNFTGTVIIDENALVKAYAQDEGAGIGTGGNGNFTGTVMIGGNAQVKAYSDKEGAGIGAGDDGIFTGTVIIGGNAKVNASSDDGTGIGCGEKGDFSGVVVIRDNAAVTANGDSNVSDIGLGEDGKSDGATVVIGRNAVVTAKHEKIDNRIDIDVSTGEDGSYSVTPNTDGVTAGNILYGGAETLPTEPGTYTVTCVLTQGEKTYTVPIGELVIPEPEPITRDNAQTEPLYRVTDKGGKNISYETEQKDGVLTITVDADLAVLTGTLTGINSLKAQGVKKIVFVTKNAISTFTLADLLEKGSRGEEYKLTHDTKTVTFTIGAKNTDVSDILEKS